jgi:hypothetical protein
MLGLPETVDRRLNAVQVSPQERHNYWIDRVQCENFFTARYERPSTNTHCASTDSKTRRRMRIPAFSPNAFTRATNIERTPSPVRKTGTPITRTRPDFSMSTFENHGNLPTLTPPKKFNAKLFFNEFAGRGAFKPTDKASRTIDFEYEID